MPTNLVKTKRDEHLWEKAKKIAAKEGREEDWAYINGIYQKMRGKRKMRKKGSLITSMEKRASGLLKPDGTIMSSAEFIEFINDKTGGNVDPDRFFQTIAEAAQNPSFRDAKIHKEREQHRGELFHRQFAASLGDPRVHFGVKVPLLKEEKSLRLYKNPILLGDSVSGHFSAKSGRQRAHDAPHLNFNTRLGERPMTLASPSTHRFTAFDVIADKGINPAEAEAVNYLQNEGKFLTTQGADAIRDAAKSLILPKDISSISRPRLSEVDSLLINSLGEGLGKEGHVANLPILGGIRKVAVAPLVWGVGMGVAGAGFGVPWVKKKFLRIQPHILKKTIGNPAAYDPNNSMGRLHGHTDPRSISGVQTPYR